MGLVRRKCQGRTGPRSKLSVVGHVEKGGIEHVAPDVVEEQIDATGTFLTESVPQEVRVVTGRLVVDGRVEARLFGKPLALGFPARDSDDFGCPVDLSDLSRD